MSPATASRRRALRRILSNRRVHSQRQLVSLLEKEGHPVTQATVSRDLDAIGAVKDHGAGTYRLEPEVPPAGQDAAAVARALADFVESIAVSDNLVVLHTPPGAAHLVASAIDRTVIPGVLGTVAGDDTLIVVADDGVGGPAVRERLERIGARR